MFSNISPFIFTVSFPITFHCSTGASISVNALIEYSILSLSQIGIVAFSIAPNANLGLLVFPFIIKIRFSFIFFHLLNSSIICSSKLYILYFEKVYSIKFTLSFVLSFLVSAPKTIVIISMLFLLVSVTKHRPALFVKPVFTPTTPFSTPNNSLVLFICLD